ncbi:MAG: periplasmic heavy metal sensor [Pikeienuella sp.]
MRAVKIALLASVVLNFGLAATTATVWYRAKLAAIEPPMAWQMLEDFAEEIGGSDRALLRAAVQSKRGQFAEAQIRILAARRALADLLITEGLTADRLNLVFEKIKQTRLETSDHVVAVLSETLPEMSDAARARLRTALLRSLERASGS